MEDDSQKWKLTRDACGEPFVEDWTNQDDEDLRLGYSLLRELAADPASNLIELRPGFYVEPKTEPGS